MASHRKKFSILYLGINTNIKRSPCRLNDIFHNITDDKLLILCVGRFKSRKGQLSLLEAFHSFVQTRKENNFHLLLLGSCNSADECYYNLLKERVIELKLEENVTLGTELPNEVIDTAYDRANLYIQPSTYEGLGLAAMQAMAMGIPCVVTPVPGLSELVKDRITGFVSKDTTPKAIEESIALAFDSDTQLISKNAQSFILNNFSIKKMTEKLMVLYNQLVKERVN